MIRTGKTPRIEALDIFRALTMFLMLFVNDIPGLRDIPHWLLHARVDEDMLGFSDTIFPAFLFAMGMAIPYAIRNRIKAGDRFPEIAAHIFWRTVALLLMGVYTVNRDTLDAAASGISMPCFSLLMVLAFFLIWSVYPKAKRKKKYLFWGMKSVGIAILAYLFIIYKGAGGASFSAQWWGILGLIGWTYLVCTVVFMITGERLFLLSVAFLAIIACSLLSAGGVFSEWTWLHYLPSQATLHAFGIAGMWTSVVMQRYANRRSPGRFFSIMGITGVIMLIAGILAHHYWIVSKIQATPTWLFYCCAIFFPLFSLVYWVTDVKGQSYWFLLLKPAGTVTLTCYIIPYAWYSVEALLNVHYPAFLQAGISGLIKSLLFSLLVIGVAGLLNVMKVRLKI